jgi:uncharacterized protein
MKMEQIIEHPLAELKAEMKGWKHDRFSCLPDECQPSQEEMIAKMKTQQEEMKTKRETWIEEAKACQKVTKAYLEEMGANQEKLETMTEAVMEHYEGVPRMCLAPCRFGLVVFYMNTLKELHMRRLSEKPMTDLGTRNWP